MPLTQLETELRPRARERIASGELPCEVPARMWGGNGSGKSCCLCDKPIQHQDVEFEFEVDGRTFLFHMVCQSIWQLECAREQVLKNQSPQAVKEEAAQNQATGYG